MIRDDQHLGQILATVAPGRRRKIYNELKGYLSFKAKPFFLLRFRP